MIRKLRLKFVLINMSVVTIMMAAVFWLIFTFTSANLRRESIHMMQDIAGQPFQLEAPDQLAENVRLPSFTLQVDPGGTLLEAGGGYYDLSNREFLDSLVRPAMASPHQLGVLDEYDLRYYRFESPQTRSVVFADISSERATLDGLLRTCPIIGVISFFGFLWASILLSKWAVRPVEQAWKEQRQFIAAASHELKTPLTVIMTNAQLMSSPGCDEQKHAKFLDSILVMSRQMKKLTEQMLELARSESAEPGLAFAPVAWSGLVSRTVLPFESVFFEKGMELKVEVEEKIQVIGENMNIRRFERYEGPCAAYIHAGGTHGVLVKFETSDEVFAKPEFDVYGQNIAMQIAAMNPAYLDRASVPAEVVAKEKEIILVQMANDPKDANKPEAIKEKIALGRVSKYYKENCLVEQAYVQDDKETIASYTEKTGKELGGSIKIVAFARFEKGEGIEKKADDFASEVASMVK